MKKGERLEKLIEGSHHKNVYRFSKVTGIPYTTIKSLIERDLEKASIDNVVKIAKELGVSVEYLINENQEEMEQMQYSSSYSYIPTKISAGKPLVAEPVTEYELEEISIPDALMGKWAGNRDIKIMRINGESMNKVIPHNSLIAVKRVELDELRDSDIVVYSNDYEYAVKRFYKDDCRLIFRPDSKDKRFIDHIVDLDNANNLKIHGKVVLYIVELD